MCAYESLATANPPREKQNALGRALALVAASARAHIRKPQIPILVLSFACFELLLQQIRDSITPTALVRMWAPAPLDVFGDIGSTIDLGLGWTTLAVFIRLVAVITVLRWILGLSTKRSQVIRTCAVYAVASITFFIPLALSLLYFNSRAQSRGGTVLLAVLVAPLIHIVLTAILSPAVARALQGKVKIAIEPIHIWILAALSTWLWMYFPGRVTALATISGPVAFTMAFAVVLFQSILYGAIALNYSRLPHLVGDLSPRLHIGRTCNAISGTFLGSVP